MSNEYRPSDIFKRQSRRRTLLCCSTLCLFSFLIFFLLLTEVFHSRHIDNRINSNKSISLNVMKYRSSLIDCGQSVIQKDKSYQFIEELTLKMQSLSQKQDNNEVISLEDEFNNQYIRKEIINWLEYLLDKCYQARQFSIIEQEKPTKIRQILSILRKEIFYIAAFFIKDI